ncbi:Nek1, partial [Symbiodinium necroappetens]
MMQNILCFASGYVNALTIIDMGMTVSHQTGNTSHAGRLIMNGGAAFFHLMAAFAAGSFVAGYSKSDGEAVYQGRYSPNMLASTFC